MVAKAKVLITGGSGFIGSHLVKVLIDCGYDVISISRTKPNKIRAVKKAHYIEHNIRKEITKDIEKKIESVEYIINCSGYVDHTSFKDGGKSVFKDHYNIPMKLIDLSRLVNLRTFVHLGSSDEYGNLQSPISEDVRECPISPYSLGKLTATHFLQQMFRLYKIPIIVLRPFIVFGENQETNRFLPYLISNCLASNTFGVTEGGQLRDYCYVGDVCNAILKCFDNNKAYGQVINIGSGEPVSIKTLTNSVVNIIGSGKPCFGEVPYRESESMALYPNIIKAKSLLKWEPTNEMNKNLNKVINWYKEYA
ncbi:MULTISPECIES: NAD-dependent epimerase/dehydratase family protein [Prochlorococcus]|uniref:NAD-dependent epimerase/dehydratase family protein n=1 Tax=Prochlorococcus TaxID=1218 RepID=UPI000533BBF7|nr:MULTISPECIES: NAD-dependent epimerase/dehydratase family protein [Prochlorococcus]KGG12037.1 UDP-glucose 4-epimerase [Prochlorococcus sp. MIT 0601]